jgi:hypothetical protein
MRYLLLLPVLLVGGCAAPSTAYTVAPPQAVAMEAQNQEQMIQRGKNGSRGLDRGVPSLSARLPEDQRLGAIAERIMIAASPYCGNQLTGAYAVSVGTPDNGPPVVINAAEPLAPGDRIMAMDGQEVPYGRRGFSFLNQRGGAKASSGQPLQLTAQRGGQVIEATYAPVSACALPVVLENNNQWNAYADGEAVHIERRLLNDLSNDDDLAFTIAHEFSHNLLSHVQKQQQNVMAGAAIGLGIEAILAGSTGGRMSGDITKTAASMGGLTYSQEFEREADYVGLYILANAGYDLEAGPRVARRIARQDPRAIRYASSHPSSADRAASLMATINEIQQKAQSGQPVVPNMAPPRG